MPPLPFAAPSCVLPATVADNARFLAGRVAEVGLCLFEAQSCLNYGREDLPGDLAALPLRWHAHLPVDLPWEAGGGAAAALALAVLHKVSYLRPHLVVLHPPVPCAGRSTQTLLQEFRATWHKHGAIPLLLENIDTCDLASLPPELWEVGEGPEALGVCLDVGHALGFGHSTLLACPHLLKRVGLVHWSAPGARDQHLPLTRWTGEQRAACEELVPLLPAGAVHMAEIFHWAGVEASLPVLQQLLEL